MIRTLLATTALAALLTSGAAAQEGAAPADPTTIAPAGEAASGYLSAAPDQVLASAVIGKTVYTGSDEEGEAIGDVNDVVINADGGAEALVVGVGGFLGIGEKDVAVNFDRVSWSDRDGQRIIVVTATKEELQAAPPFERNAVTDSVAATGPEAQSGTTPSKGPVLGDETAESTEPPLGTTPEMTDPDLQPQIDTDTTASTPPPELRPVDPGLVSADKLIGTQVKVADDSSVGEIGDVVLGKDGKVEAYVIDVGGFLGIGQKPIAMSAESVQVMADAEGTMTIFSPYTKAQLESQPAYDAEAYKANPRGVLLSAPAN